MALTKTNDHLVYSQTVRAESSRYEICTDKALWLRRTASKLESRAFKMCGQKLSSCGSSANCFFDPLKKSKHLDTFLNNDQKGNLHLEIE